MKELIMEILMNLIQLGVLAGLGALINYLNAKAGSENISKFYEYAKIAVRAMEGTILEKGMGAKKKEEAVKFLALKTKGKLSEEELNLLIQSAFEETVKVLRDKGLEKGE